MIKVIVAISGLVLAQFHEQSRTIDLYFPVSDGSFAAEVKGHYNPPYGNRILLDQHEVAYRLGKKANGDDWEEKPASALEFRLEAPAYSPAEKPDWADLIYFPHLDVLASPYGAIRTECAGPDTSMCMGKDVKQADKNLLVGKISLSGKWKLVAGETQDKTNSPQHYKGLLAPFLRVLATKPVDSAIHSASGIAFADTLVFETEVNSATDVKIYGENDLPLQDLELDAPGGFCKQWDKNSKDCRLVWFENAPTIHPSGKTFLDRGDSHFVQLYRLLAIYDATEGKFQQPLYVPFGTYRGDSLTAEGDHSPRCYQGVLVN